MPPPPLPTSPPPLPSRAPLIARNWQLALAIACLIALLISISLHGCGDDRSAEVAALRSELAEKDAEIKRLEEDAAMQVVIDSAQRREIDAVVPRDTAEIEMPLTNDVPTARLYELSATQIRGELENQGYTFFDATKESFQRGRRGRQVTVTAWDTGKVKHIILRRSSDTPPPFVDHLDEANDVLEIAFGDLAPLAKEWVREASRDTGGRYIHRATLGNCSIQFSHSEVVPPAMAEFRYGMRLIVSTQADPKSPQ